MTETIKFVDGINYTEADQADFNMSMRPQGVLAENALGVLNWSAIGGLFIRVVPGAAFIRGFLYKNDANKDIAVGANASGSTRIDTLVIRVNPTANTAVAQLVVGTPGAGAPTLTQIAGGIWDFPLCDITVANGASSITAPNITGRNSMSLWPASTIDITAEIAARLAPPQLKAWALFTGSTSLSVLASKGIASITWSNATGSSVYTITLSAPLTNYGVQVSVEQPAPSPASYGPYPNYHIVSTTVFQVWLYNPAFAGTSSAPASITVSVLGN